MVSIYKDIDEVRRTVLTNVIKILYLRGWFKDITKILADIPRMKNDKEIYQFTTDGEAAQGTVINNKIYVKYIRQNVTSLNKCPNLTRFMNDYKESYKIIIVEKITGSTASRVVASYGRKTTEILQEREMMVNIFEHNLSPKYQILSEHETSELLEAYDLKLDQLPRILTKDPVVRYLRLEKDQVLRIIRASESSGNFVTYRVVF